MRLKNAGHDPLTKLYRADWDALVKAHPDGFDALLYRAVNTATDDSDASYTDLNSRNDAVTYADPVLVAVVESTNDDAAFMSSWDGGDSMGTGEGGIIILRIADSNVPEGSIVEFEVSMNDGETQRQWWYVQRAEAYGTPAIGVIYYCIPCGDLEQMAVPDEAAADLMATSTVTTDTGTEGALYGTA